MPANNGSQCNSAANTLCHLKNVATVW